MMVLTMEPASKGLRKARWKMVATMEPASKVLRKARWKKMVATIEPA